MSNLVKHQNSAVALSSIDEIKDMSSILFQSGMFSDAKSAAQVFTKILAGKELGFPAFASITGVHIIKGRPCVSANLMAAAIKNHPKYRFKIIEHTNEICKLEFFEKVDAQWESLGYSQFTIEDAKSAGLLSNQTWKAYPRNMLYARAISNGARWHCPDVFMGSPVYTPEELNQPVNEDGEIITVESTPVKIETTNWKTPMEAIEWASDKLNCSIEDATLLYENTQPDEMGRKGSNFKATVLASIK